MTEIAPAYGPVTQGPPPYLRFEDSFVEDREATIQDGTLRYKPVILAVVQASGSKDVFIKAAAEWLDDIESRSRTGMYPTEWVATFRRMYAMYQEGKELPEDGTPIRMCGFIGLADQEACVGANIKTLETLADANEQAIGRIGANGRILKARAQAALQQQAGGRVALQMESLQLRIEELERKNAEKDALLEQQKITLESALRSKK